MIVGRYHNLQNLDAGKIMSITYIDKMHVGQPMGYLTLYKIK